MFDLIRSEIRKIRTTRTGLGIVIGAALAVALGTVSTVMSVETGQLTGPIHDQMFYFLASINLGVFALILGVRGFTDEYRHGTIVSTFLSSTDRIRVLGTKIIVSALAAVVMTLGALVIMIALAMALAGMKDGSVSVTADDVRAFTGLAAGMAGWATIGTTVGAIIRHQVAAIVGGLVWVLVAENMASGFVPELSRFTPGQAVTPSLKQHEHRTWLRFRSQQSPSRIPARRSSPRRVGPGAPRSHLTVPSVTATSESGKSPAQHSGFVSYRD